jgi:hypothetical protein
VFPDRPEVDFDPGSPGHGHSLLGKSYSASTLALRGYLEVLGSNFGSSGQVVIDGISVPRSPTGRARASSPTYRWWRIRHGTKEKLIEIAGHAEQLAVEVSHLMQSRPAHEIGDEIKRSVGITDPAGALRELGVGGDLVC